MNKTLTIVLGLVALGVLGFFCIRGHTPAIVQDLLTRTSSALAGEGMSWASVSADGRELHLRGVASSAELRDHAADLASQIWGVRTVSNQITVAISEPVASEPPVEEVLARSCQEDINKSLPGQRILFDTGSAQIDPNSFALLDALAEIVSGCPSARIEIAGHTDSRGSEELNRRLSQARAESVANYLTSKGVSADRLSAIGYGELRPIADNETLTGRARNRRIEFKVEGN